MTTLDHEQARRAAAVRAARVAEEQAEAAVAARTEQLLDELDTTSLRSNRRKRQP